MNSLLVIIESWRISIKIVLYVLVILSQSFFIVHDKNRILQKHAVPTIIIGRVKGAKTVFSELKEEMIQPTSFIGGSSNLQMKRILVKVTDNSELEHGNLPLIDLELNKSMANISTDAVNSSTNIAEITDNSEPINSTLQLINNDLDRSMVNASPDRFESFNSSIPTVEEKLKSAYLTASKTSVDDTPRRSFLKYGIRQLLNEIQIKNSKLKALQQTIRRQDKKIVVMSKIIKNLKK
uniref:Uncharacterized protein n=1 Tax=Schizaphis graminum TaxID=13262 RepID=A0A2S2NZW6_SCHGA